ncbi:hypothetical protein HPP92_011624 [Vanilla planifolia]|uniref:Pseudouridine synthase RsuA/RluA-like domain-containing protein n=1 Tax=Vanilla planifolia TaxID=51239 RepID=A0A835R0Z2_VANPL|nr:hypothetical protein HPP92_011624 [Vanilla planifolia]
MDFSVSMITEWFLRAEVERSMSELLRLGRRHFSRQPSLAQVEQINRLLLHFFCSSSSSSLLEGVRGKETTHEHKKWLNLPPYAPQRDASSVAKEISGGNKAEKEEALTSLKWVRRCCPHLPISLLQKLFRLRQVRKEIIFVDDACSGAQSERKQLKRISSKEVMKSGEVILLPVTLQNFADEKNEQYKPNEIKFIRSLILYKDSSIIVINKPHGLPVQGGIGIKHSIDVLAASSLKFDYPDAPRLVHRLDRDSSGLLVIGRNLTSSSILHSIFREKTGRILKDSVKDAPRVLQRKYWALVIGSPTCSSGLVSAPVGKVTIQQGKSERITVIKDEKPTSSQHALTEYKVIKTSSNGYTWLELRPLTGRKHQLRVHCAEVLRTPIVGDYKYGRQAHREWKPVTTDYAMKCPKEKLPFGLDFEGGSICEKQPRLHLHCRQMILPNIAEAVRCMDPEATERCDFAEVDVLDLVAPLPLHMQLSWDVLKF